MCSFFPKIKRMIYLVKHKFLKIKKMHTHKPIKFKKIITDIKESNKR